MKLRTIIRHLLTAIKNVGRNGWMTFASVSAVAVTLLLLGVFLTVMMNLDHFAKNLENDVEIRVFVDSMANEENKTLLKQQIEDINGVESVKFSSKDQELKNLINSFKEEGSVFKMFEQENPLHDVYVVKAKSPRETGKVADQIQKFEFASKVIYGKDQIKTLFSTVDVARKVGFALIGALIFTAVFLISNTIKITIFARRREIEIMRLVGATNWFIRWPFVIEGLFLGLLGALIPTSLIYWGYTSFYDVTEKSLSSSFAALLPPLPFLWQVGTLLVVIGSCIGMIGSAMSIRKFLKI